MYLLGLCTLLIVGCTANVIPESRHTRLAHAVNDLAFQLLRPAENEKNVFISPFSISTALAMIYAGADGTTAEKMRRVLHYDQYELLESDVIDSYDWLQRNRQGYNFSSYNGALFQNGLNILNTYEHTLREAFNVTLENVNFQTQGEEIKERINTAIENATRGKIREFLQEPPSDETKLFLFNAVYFLGTWKDLFNVDSSYERTFYNNGVEGKRVKFMSRNDYYEYSTNNDLGASVVVLPYRDDAAEMIIVLPNQRTGINELQHRLNRETLEEAIGNLQNRRIDLLVPKFSMSYSVELRDKLTTLGLGELFDNPDLSRIARGESRVKVSKVLHNAFIDVDEKGTEAAGATGIEMIPMTMVSIITVDHPFLFFIRENRTGLILFSGRVDEL